MTSVQRCPHFTTLNNFVPHWPTKNASHASSICMAALCKDVRRSMLHAAAAPYHFVPMLASRGLQQGLFYTDPHQANQNQHGRVQQQPK
mmetsp:Transcript_24211/g.71873  ORF Transcript_24211/g.71873 Transcript_24211/m.71873 type:complete len:89 (+) Transcript_24211:607-873(+)